MKKKIVNVLLSVALVTAMMFSATACGSKTDDAQNTAADAPAATQQAADANANAADAGAADTETKAADADENKDNADDNKDDAADGGMTLEEWTESDTCIQFLEMMNEGMADQGVSIFFEVDGDVIAMVYQYDEQIEVADDAEEQIGQLFDSNASLFESVRDALIEETGYEDTILRIEYRNADDSVIYSQDF